MIGYNVFKVFKGKNHDGYYNDNRVCTLYRFFGQGFYDTGARERER